jgi:hypothetical protein
MPGGLKARTIAAIANVIYDIFLVSSCGVRLSPLGTAPSNWPIVPDQDDR